MNAAHIVANIGALTAVENVGMYSIKRSQTNGEWLFYILASLIYGILVPFFFMRSLQYEGLGTVNFFWNVASTLSAFAIGAFFFKEKVTSWKMMGVTLSLLGLGMILMSDKDTNNAKIKTN